MLGARKHTSFVFIRWTGSCVTVFILYIFTYISHFEVLTLVSLPPMVMVAPSKVLWWLTRASGHPHWGAVRPLLTEQSAVSALRHTSPEGRSQRRNTGPGLKAIGRLISGWPSSPWAPGHSDWQPLPSEHHIPPQWAQGLRVSSCPGQCGSVGWALSHAPKACLPWIPALPFVTLWHWASYSTSLSLSFFTTSEILRCAIVKA